MRLSFNISFRFFRYKYTPLYRKGEPIFPEILLPGHKFQHNDQPMGEQNLHAFIRSGWNGEKKKSDEQTLTDESTPAQKKRTKKTMAANATPLPTTKTNV